MQYPDLSNFFGQQGQFQPGKRGSGLTFVGGKYFDPGTGQLVKGRSKRQMTRNPFGIHLGNVINPYIDYSPLNQMANRPISTQGSLL